MNVRHLKCAPEEAITGHNPCTLREALEMSSALGLPSVLPLNTFENSLNIILLPGCVCTRFIFLYNKELKL